MKRSSVLEFAGLVALAALTAGWGWGKGKCPEAPAPASAYTSPEFVVPSPDGKSVYVTSGTGAKMMCVPLAGGDVRSWKIESTQAAKTVPVNPTGAAVGPDGAVYVTAGVQCGELQKFDASGKLLKSALVGHSPRGPVVSADGKLVFVLNRFANMVSVVDAAKMEVVKTIPVPREPFAAALGAGGKLLFVANLLPNCPSTDDVVSANVSVIDTATFAVKNVRLPNGSTGVRGICASPDGKNIYVTHTMGRYQLPTTQLERGWMNTAALSVFCGESGAYINTVLLDDVDRGAANPWGVCVTPDGRTLVVAHAGTCEISIIDRKILHERLEKAARGESVSGIVKHASDVSNDLAFLMSIRRRVHMGGDGPRGVAVVGGKAVVALYFADKLAVADLADAAAPVQPIVVGNTADIAKDRVRRGEMLYNDGSMCFQQWQSCASCHPDGRIDGLNWDLLNDGMGNPKQTKSQLYGQFTPPTMATGIRKDMQTCNRAGLIHIQFVQRPEEDGLCLDAYTESISPIPSPYLVNGELSDKAKRGKKVFEKAQCTLCHGDQTKTPDGKSLYTDCKLYDVKLGVATEKGRKFDTPSLCEVWRTAPYLYDGRALTMMEVLTTFNKDDEHGVTQGLSKDELEDLNEYVLSL